MSLRLPETTGITEEILERHLRSKDLAPDLDTLPPAAVKPLRRLLWAKQLKVVSGSTLEEWATQLEAARQQYKDIKEGHRSEQDVKKFNPTICNPLAKSADNPLLKMQANKDLQEEIWKDIERTYSEMEIFQNDKVRKCMQQVLFHWCKACNPAADAAESYRQGMNELVALCMYVVLQGQWIGSTAEGSLGARLCAEVHNEGDTFALFSALMEVGGLREMFEVVKPKKATKGPAFASGGIGDVSALGGRSAPNRPQQTRSAILARCDHIYNTMLKKIDVRLHSFLVEMGIEPQIFMLKWLRLLFCREFQMEDTLSLWTAVFADSMVEHPESSLAKYQKKPGKGMEGIPVAEASSIALPLVDYFAVAMVVYMKSELLGMDEMQCMKRLMHFPPVEDIGSLVTLAKKLRAGIPTAPTPPAAPIQIKDTSPAARPVLSTSQPREETAARAAPPLAKALSPRPVGGEPLSPSPLFTPGERAAVPDNGLASQLADMRRKVEKLEQEKIAIATKGRQFIAQKTAEFQAKVAELEAKVASGRGGDVNEAVEIAEEAVRKEFAGIREERDQLLKHSQTLFTDGQCKRAVATAQQATEEECNQKWGAKVAELEAALTASKADAAGSSGGANEEVAAAKAETAALQAQLAAANLDKEAAEQKAAVEEAAAAECKVKLSAAAADNVRQLQMMANAQAAADKAASEVAVLCGEAEEKGKAAEAELARQAAQAAAEKAASEVAVLCGEAAEATRLHKEAEVAAESKAAAAQAEIESLRKQLATATASAAPAVTEAAAEESPQPIDPEGDL